LLPVPNVRVHFEYLFALADFELRRSFRICSGICFFDVVGGEIDDLGLICSQLLWELFCEEVIVPVDQVAEHMDNRRLYLL